MPPLPPRLAAHLRSTAPPWVMRWPAEPEAGAALLALDDLQVRLVAGAASGTPLGLLGRTAAVLGFTAYFGLNWAALGQALADLGTFPGSRLVLVFDEAGRVLPGQEDARKAFVETLEATGAWWAARGHPFHAVLLAEAGGGDGWRLPEAIA